MNSLRIHNGRVLMPEGWRQADLVIRGDRIAEVAAPGARVHRGEEVIDAAGGWVVPGFVDLHVNGGGGVDFQTGAAEGFGAALGFHARGGTTALLMALNTAPAEERRQSLERVRGWMAQQEPGPEVIGVYVEGPYYHVNQCGAHPAELLHAPEPREYEPLLERYGDLIRVFSLAPELPGALPLIRALTARGIVPACGHSEASYAELSVAIDAGLRLVTHVYCAHSSFHRQGAEKRLGVAETALLRDELAVELIPDGKHLTPELVRLILKCKPWERVAITTDAISAAGLSPGEHTLMGRRIYVDEHVAYREDRQRFAGSILTMAAAVRFMVKQAGLDLSDAARMASMVPAEILGLAHRKGALAPGMDADAVILNDTLHVRATLCRGVLIHGERVERPFIRR